MNGKQMATKCVIAVFLLLAMHAFAAANTIYTIDIFDATENLAATVSPPGTGSLTITPEGTHTAGEVYWELPHAVTAVEDYYYNIWEGEVGGQISDTLAVMYDIGVQKVVVQFRSDSLSEDDIWAYPSPTGSLPEVGSVQFALAGGDTLVVNYTSPEPGTLALLGTGALGLLAYAWRRRKLAA